MSALSNDFTETLARIDLYCVRAGIAIDQRVFKDLDDLMGIFHDGEDERNRLAASLADREESDGE